MKIMRPSLVCDFHNWQESLEDLVQSQHSKDRSSSDFEEQKPSVKIIDIDDKFLTKSLNSSI